MAELVAKKSSNVVSNNSNKKNSDVCSVQSNNGLIDLDNITASNNQLITLCDDPEDEDDIIITRNTKNELTADDKSLQEMIESELALRICSANETEELVNVDDDDDDDDDEDKTTNNQPEVAIKKIILEPRQDPMDINAEFIGAEMEHYTIVEDPYTYRNGHTRPGSGESRSPERPDNDELISTDNHEREEETFSGSQSIDETINEERANVLLVEDPVVSLEETEVVRPDDDVVEDEILVESEKESVWSPSVDASRQNGSDDVSTSEDIANRPRILVDKHGEEENDREIAVDQMDLLDERTDEALVETNETENDTKDCRKNLDFTDISIDPVAEEFNNPQVGQFSDDFSVPTTREEENLLELEEPEADQDRGIDEKSILPVEDNFQDDKEASRNFLVDYRTETDVSSGNNHELTTDNNTVDLDLVFEESEKTSESCLSADSSQIEVLPSSLSDVNGIGKTRFFIDEERKALQNENLETSQVDAASKEETSKSDIGTLKEGVKSYPGENVELEEESTESSWMTVEEATNDRNKLTETINERNNYSNEIQGLDTNTNNKVTSTTNATTHLVFTESEVNYVASTDNDEISFHNTTKIDNSCAQDASTIMMTTTTSPRLLLSSNTAVAPLATPDDESSELSNVCDSENREEVITSSSVVTSSSTISTKSSTKTKKKKIEGVAGNDASPTLTPRTKKTKKSKKNDLEKENISVNINAEDPSMHTGSHRMSQEMDDFSNEDDLSNVNVKSLTQSYVSETSRGEQEKSNKEVIETGVSIKQLCRSFGDISNMTDVDQAGFAITEQTSETHERAKSMDDLRLCQRNFKKLSKDATVFVGVSVKALRASYCSLANLTRDVDDAEQERARAKRLNFEKSSFNKFDALSKKSVLHVRSVDAGKVQQQLNSVGQNGDANPNCRSCGKVVFQMEQTKAEGLVWHKNCFRCVQCSKQLNVDNYQSHESTLYCKAHFKELFQPKPVEESDQPVRPRKPEMIIRENQPKELPPDVVRASDKPDLGLEELSSLNVKSRFQVFEKSTNDTTNEIERSPSQVVKRSPSILSKLAKFQAKGMDIGVADDSLNGIPYEESSESEEEEEIDESEELDTEIIKAKRTTRERPISFTKMDDIKNRWECTSQQGRRESQREARKEEIAGIRSRLFMGKQGKMKEMYQQAVAESEKVTKTNPTEEIQHSTHARSIKERFERGEPIATSDGENETKPKQEKPDEEVIAAGISRKSRSLFLELDATAAKTGRPVTPVNPKTPTDVSRRARDAFMGRQVSDDVVRSTDTTEEVQVETSDISNKFKFFETYKEPTKERKQFRITPPRDGQDKMGSPEREIYRDPDVVRADDRVDEVVHTDTARKMLSIFRQMEEKATKEDIPDGPKPLKRFTPPPEDKFAKATASESDEEEDEEGEESDEDESGEERDPNYVRASDKVEDEFLKQAQNAARAKTLRAKFEHWDTTDGKVTNHHVAEMDMAQGNGDQASIESASSLRARFESLGSQASDAPRAPKVKVNRFVEIQTICMDVCESCQKKVYPLEKVETNNKIFHKQCFRCLQCNCVLRMDTFTLNNGKLYCIPHFKQLFIARGNYDEGFGVDPHKNKWAVGNTNSNSASQSAPIAVSNGRATSVVNRV